MIISALKANIIEYGSLYMYRELVEFSPKSLYELSGVSLGSIRRFEQTGEISLTSLMKISIALQDTDNFTALFRKKEKTYSTIEELINDRNRESKRHH